MKICKQCQCEINKETGVLLSGGTYRRVCKKCRSKNVMAYQAKDIKKRRKTATDWLRKSGRVKEYPCLTCGKLCIMKYALAICSDVCRFMYYVEKTDYCWIWNGGRNRSGYGKFIYKSKTIPAHRFSYEAFVGPIDENKYVCHACDNPPCVNWHHLWQGTNSENQQDSIKKGRHRWQKNREVKNGPSVSVQSRNSSAK